MANAGHLLPPYINGRFAVVTKPERTFQAANPARPSDILAVSGWNKELVSEIVDGMKSAQAKFQRLDFPQRLKAVEVFIGVLRANAEEIKSHMMLELARSRVAVEEEWALCEMLFQILPKFCEEALSEKADAAGWSWSYAPVGLVLLSSNVALPVYSLLSAALPSLVAGNSVCLRPSLHCPLSASLLASAFHQAAFPPGLVQLVYGDLEVYRRLLLTHQFDTVLYTGGEESLEQIRRDLSTHQNTRLVLCSGGKNAALIMPSANIDDAVAKIVYGACVDCGQRLESTSIAFVHQKVAAEFTEKFVKAIKAMPIGVRSDLASGTENVMGPLCSATSWERYLRFQGIAARESDETLRWGKPIDNAGNGFFVSPGVHAINADRILKSVYAGNAFFGPDVALVTVDSHERAVQVLNELSVARALSVHTAFDEEVRLIRKVTNVPTVSWNRPTTALEPYLPTIGRGRAGNSYVTGVRFLFSTVFPKTLSLGGSTPQIVETSEKSAKSEKPSRASKSGKAANTLALLVAVLSSLFAGAFSPDKANADYRKAVEGNDVVKGKFYPKGGRFQLNALQGGTIMNQSFIDTYLISLGVTYHFNEWHALSVEGFYGLNSDRNERTCVENFYFDPKRASSSNGSKVECSPAKDAADKGNNDDPNNAEENAKDFNYKNRGPYHRKPAYMPIRQIDAIALVNYQWTPVYGKALWFLSAVGYLDFYTSVGLGVAMNKYYPLKDQIGPNSDKGDSKVVGTADGSEYGIEGRPVALSQTSPLFAVGLGSRFFFAKNFLVNVEFRNFTLLGSNGKGGSDIMNFFALWGGLGVLF